MFNKQKASECLAMSYKTSMTSGLSILTTPCQISQRNMGIYPTVCHIINISVGAISIKYLQIHIWRLQGVKLWHSHNGKINEKYPQYYYLLTPV